jgi:ankyrin repeat protein
MSLLLENEADVVSATTQDKFYNSLLSDAVENRCLASVKLLLDYGAPVDGLGNCLPPLGAAAKLGLLDIMKLLLEAGADTDIEIEFDYESADLLQLAAGVNDGAEMMKLLLEYGMEIGDGYVADEHPFVQAIRFDNFDVLNVLLDRGVVVDDLNEILEDAGIYDFSKKMRRFLQRRGLL